MTNLNTINENNILATKITSLTKKNLFFIYKKKVHNKYYIDSIIKKIKSFIIKLLIIFVNKIIINRLCKNDDVNIFMKKKIFKKIKKINPYIAKNTYVIFNKNLLNATIYDILTSNISIKYNQKIDYNKKLINN